LADPLKDLTSPSLLCVFKDGLPKRILLWDVSLMQLEDSGANFGSVQSNGHLAEEHACELGFMSSRMPEFETERTIQQSIFLHSYMSSLT
jgi:hypothetical protein